MALVLKPETFDAKEYAACNMSAALLWKPENELFAKAVKTELPWHGHAKPRRFYGNEGARRFDEGMQSRMTDLRETFPGCDAWLVWDEPEGAEDIEVAARIVSWLKANHPGTLVYTNANPGGHEEFKGLKPKDGRGYQDYLRDITGTMRPDVLMVDFYPFFKDPYGDRVPFFRFLCQQIRSAALEADMPYWMFVQAYSEAIPGNNNDRRYPSESDVRIQVFTSLAFGFTGISYFLYCPGFERTMLDEDGSPAPLYHHVARLNREVANVGRTLRFLRSEEVCYVPGRHVEDGRTVANAEDPHLKPWQAGSGRRYGVSDVKVVDEGLGRNALVGFFKDDDEQSYFMLVNLRHRSGAAASETRTTLTVQLAPGVEEVRRLSRETGTVEVLSAPGGTLELTLPGGTGDLLTTGPGGFPGLGR